jgi:predicted  nucleic acid-binding Zn-ribbon protein
MEIRQEKNLYDKIDYMMSKLVEQEEEIGLLKEQLEQRDEDTEALEERVTALEAEVAKKPRRYNTRFAARKFGFGKK